MQRPLEELPVKPFFFASVDLIERFLRSQEKVATAEPSGESRPLGAADADAQARSGSSATQ